jgi:hypothetical protein
VAERAFEYIPTIVFSSSAGSWLEIDLFPSPLTDIRDEKVSGDAVESTAPWVAHAVCPNLVQRVRVAHKRVVRWHCVVAIRVAGEVVAVDVHAKDLAQPGIEILPVLLRVPAAAAIAERDVQVTIRTKGELSAVMVGEGLVLIQDRVT